MRPPPVLRWMLVVADAVDHVEAAVEKGRKRAGHALFVVADCINDVGDCLRELDYRIGLAAMRVTTCACDAARREKCRFTGRSIFCVCSCHRSPRP